MELKAYDHNCADEVFSELFTKGLDREDGLKEIPSASLQLVVSALEYIRWDGRNANERDAILKAIGIVERLRDEQKMREWRRRHAE